MGNTDFFQETKRKYVLIKAMNSRNESVLNM